MRTILVIDDDEIDVEFLARAIKSTKRNLKVDVCIDGVEAKEYFDAGNRPVLVFLDINMPRMNGHELLDYARSVSDLQHVPIVIASTSDNNQDITKCYDKCANGYLVKGRKRYDKQEDREKDFQHDIGVLLEYWLDVVVIPKGN